MANLSKIKRDQMIAFLESLKESHSDDASIQAFNEIENHIRDKKYGLVWEESLKATTCRHCIFWKKLIVAEWIVYTSILLITRVLEIGSIITIMWIVQMCTDTASGSQ